MSFLFSTILLVGISVFIIRFCKAYTVEKASFKAKKTSHAKPVKFKTKALLSYNEAEVKKTLDKVVPIVFGDTAKVHTKVSFSAFITSDDDESEAASALAVMAAAPLMIDFLITGPNNVVICAIDHFSENHYGRGIDENTEVVNEDLLKKDILKKSGVPLAILANTSTEGYIKEVLRGFQ